jgi:hypothetical protein
VLEKNDEQRLRDDRNTSLSGIAAFSQNSLRYGGKYQGFVSDEQREIAKEETERLAPVK